MATKVKIYKVGDVIKFKTNNWSGYGYNIGDTATLLTVNNNLTATVKDKNGANNGNPVAINITTVYVEHGARTKAELKAEVKELQKEIEETQDKIDWMDETGSDIYDETEVKVWKTLKTIKSDMTEIEKAKVIAKLIKG